MDEKEMLKAIITRNAGYNGKFYYGVKTTKIVCNPSCRARVPKTKNIVFFDSVDEAVKNGFRPCKICMKNITEEK